MNIAGPSDLVHTFSDATNGQWVFSVRQFIPSTSTGTNYVDLTPGLRFTPSGGASLYAFIQLPIYERVNEAQLAPRSSFVVGVSKTF